MDKADAYSKLFKLQESGHSINKYIGLLAKSDNVPSEVLDYLESKNEFGDKFLKNLSNKKFYKTITESDDPYELAKGLSSLVTHSLIEMSTNPEELSIIRESIDIKRINESITDFVLTGSTTALLSTTDYVKSILKRGDNQ